MTKEKLPDLLTQAEMLAVQEDIYSSEERAKAESLLAIAEEYLDIKKRTNTFAWSQNKPEVMNDQLKLLRATREALIQKILEFM